MIDYPADAAATKAAESKRHDPLRETLDLSYDIWFALIADSKKSASARTLGSGSIAGMLQALHRPLRWV
jgi:hypothetical protein